MSTHDSLPAPTENPDRPPLRAATRSRHRPYLIVASLAAVVGGLVFLMADSAGFEYYKHVDEVMAQPARWRDKKLQLHGFVVPGSIAKRFDRDHNKLEFKFRAENCGQTVDVRFAGVPPDTFKDGAEVVLKGQFDGSQFHTHEIMAKCPSKYAQAGEAQSAMITRCARDDKDKDRAAAAADPHQAGGK